ncbi:MAG: hypothetical protein BEV12_24255 [Microcystis aeruginosa CACIAM 03]|nr:MAG: hypothetical protein BEV12_24255 [Microcystis aeruginosa CACIAM 03]
MEFSSAGNMTELLVFNRFRQTLQKSQVNSVQLVPPGGQAPLSITYRSPNNIRRTVFPNFLGHMGGHIFLGELKPLYSAQDSRKVF